MWKAFSNLSSNKTLAINGDGAVSALAFSGLSLNATSGRRSHGRSSPSDSSTNNDARTWAPGSAHNPLVMPVKPNIVQDVFCDSYSAWPLGSDTDWETVFTVSANFKNHKLPPLWTPLSSRAERAQAFAANEGKCLNCHGTNHDMRHCKHKFMNLSGMLNNDYATLPEGEEMFQMWLRRMRSHRTKYPHNTNGARSNQQHTWRPSQPARSSHRPGQHAYSANYQRANNNPPQTAALTVYQPSSTSAIQPYHQRG